jgi:type I restriction enzyme S subunit
MEFLEEMEYVGDIPEGWKWVKLGEVVFINSKNLTSNYQYDEIYYLETGSIAKGRLSSSYKKFYLKEAPSRAKRIVNGGDIVYSLVRPIQRHYGIIKNPPKNLIVSTGFTVITADNNKADNRFIYYYLTLDEIVEYLDSIAEGSTTAYPSIVPDDLKNLIIPLPPLPEQKAIAEVLSSIDDKIELLHRQNKTLEEMAMILFRQWFIEPAKDGLPEEWEKVSLGEFIKEVLSGDWGKDEPEGEYKVAINCIRGTDISDLQNGLPKKTPVRFLKENKFKSIEPKDSDIIIEISGGTENQSTGRAVYINSLNRQLFEYPIIFSNFCRLLRPKENHYTYYLYLYLKYLYINDEFFSLENGTSGIKNLDYKTLLYDLKYPMPKNAEIYSSFYENVSILFEKIDKNKLQIQNLEKLRDTLLPKLMSGEIRVRI